MALGQTHFSMCVAYVLGDVQLTSNFLPLRLGFRSNLAYSFRIIFVTVIFRKIYSHLNDGGHLGFPAHLNSIMNNFFF